MFLHSSSHWNKIIHLLFCFLLNYSVSLFASTSVTDMQNEVNKFDIKKVDR